MDPNTRRRRFHLALAVEDLPATIADYSVRLGQPPVRVVEGRYALWRTPEINLSVSVTDEGSPLLRHVGFEDPDAVAGPRQADVNGLPWEAFTSAHQDEEIERVHRPPA